MVQFLPDEALAPLRRGADALDVHPVFRPQQLHVVVGRHLPQRSRHALGALDVHVAPPEDGLDALEHRQPPMVPQDSSELRVHPALDDVVGGRERPLRREAGVEVREQGPRPDQRRQAAARLAQPLVRVDEAPVGQAPLVEEVGPEPRPLEEALGPPSRLVGRLDMEQLLRQRVQLDARLELRLGRRAALDLAERVEDAPLHPGAGPLGRDGLGEPAAAVGDDDVGRRHPRQQRPPRGARLGAREVPGENVALRAGDQHHRAPGHPYPVHEHDAVHLVDRFGHRPYPPERRRPPAERPAAARHVALRVLRQQPGDEGREVARRGVVAVD